MLKSSQLKIIFLLFPIMMLFPFVACAFLNASELSLHPTIKYTTLSIDFHIFTTGTQTQTAIPASRESITICDFKFRIAKVAFEETAMGFVPVKMSAGDQVMFVEFELLTDNKEAFKGLEITVAYNAGQKSKAFILTSDGIMQMLSTVTMKGVSSEYVPDEKNIAWAYVVHKELDEIYLNFPSGEVVDLGPLIKRFRFAGSQKAV